MEPLIEVILFNTYNFDIPVIAFDNFFAGDSLIGQINCLALTKADIVPETISLEMNQIIFNCHVVIITFDGVPAHNPIDSQPEVLQCHRLVWGEVN